MPSGGVFGDLFGRDGAGAQIPEGESDGSKQDIGSNRINVQDMDILHENKNLAFVGNGQVSTGDPPGDGVCEANQSTSAQEDDYFEGSEEDVCAVCQCGFEDGSYAMVMSRCRSVIPHLCM